MTSPDPLRSLLDRVELEQAMNRYATSIDLRDWTRLRTVFVDGLIEADFTSMGVKQVFRGPAEEWVERVRQTIVGFDATQHFFANHSTEIDGDRAVDTRYERGRPLGTESGQWRALTRLSDPPRLPSRPTSSPARRLPGMYPYREYVDAGGLMSYAPSNIELFRGAATYVDKILKGAKALGFTIPQPLLLRADQVIQ